MIYERVAPDDAIRQGDIFSCVPQVSLATSEILKIDDTGAVAIDWNEIDGPTEVIATVKPITAIVITQDCDAVRCDAVAMAEVASLESVSKPTADARPNNWVRVITQASRAHQKWFYLPPDQQVGFTTKMAADFASIATPSRLDLERLRATNRLGRLCPVALAHFREKLSEFFRRYAYDEWYCLTKEEFQQYVVSYPDAKPFRWQE